MKEICFVCETNICRSILAEMYSRSIVEDKELDFHVYSVGTAVDENDMVGEKPHKKVVNLLKEKHDTEIDDSNLRGAKQITYNDVMNVDYFICMDDLHREYLIDLGANEEKIIMLTDFIAEGKLDHIPDPQITQNFKESYNLITEGCDRLFVYLEEIN